MDLSDNMSNLCQTNTTVGNSTGILKYERQWVRDEIIAASLTCVAFYLVISLAIFELRKSRIEENGKKMELKQTKCKQIENVFSRGTLCLVAAIFTFFRCLGEQIELRFGTTSDAACLVYQHLFVYNYQIPLLAQYLLLWTRQRKMYRHRTLRHLTSSTMKFISGSVILGIFLSSFITVVCYFYSFRLKSSPNGCVYDIVVGDTPSSGIPGLMMFGSAFVFQLLLLGLLVYPLIRHYHIRCLGSQQNTGSENVRRTIFRISICTLVCVISDCAASTSMAFLHETENPIMFWANMFSLNLIINVITVTHSFVDWKRRLLPCYRVDYDVVAKANHHCGHSISIV
ncbi:uncharacterized protein LOC144746361 [Ciona intestinalis]